MLNRRGHYKSEVDLGPPAQRRATARSSRCLAIRILTAVLLLAPTAMSAAHSPGSLLRGGSRAVTPTQHRGHGSVVLPQEPAHRACGHVAPSHAARAAVKAKIGVFLAAHQSRMAASASASSDMRAADSTLAATASAAVAVTSPPAAGQFPSTIVVNTYFHIARIGGNRAVRLLRPTNVLGYTPLRNAKHTGWHPTVLRSQQCASMCVLLRNRQQLRELIGTLSLSVCVAAT